MPPLKLVVKPSEIKVYASTLPIPMELGVPSPKDLPRCEQVLEKKDKGDKIMGVTVTISVISALTRTETEP